MNDNNDPQQESEIKPTTAHTSPPPRPPGTAPDLDVEKKKAITDAVTQILNGIPFIGPYIVVVKLKWGWTGLVLSVGGFMLASLMVFTGLFPERAVSDKYKNSLPQQQQRLFDPTAESRDYELKLQQDVSWDAAIRNAKSRVWASGVALRKLNPQLIAEKVKEGIPAQIVYVNPCGKTIVSRQNDENNQNALENIKGNLRTFNTYTKDFNEIQKSLLQVKLTEAYPTMVVIIIDDDLYAYFCPYGAVCSNSPVLVFKGYHENKSVSDAAKFFEDHFLAISSRLKPITDFQDPCSSSNQ
ncbi:MAG: hypothetical protein QOE47_2168 [Pyrinomonadaceae bacterium]|jgi:hypothetical protein|nr:hypothetical protein [Pyrinomonadaceae bacterium]